LRGPTSKGGEGEGMTADWREKRGEGRGEGRGEAFLVMWPRRLYLP